MARRTKKATLSNSASAQTIDPVNVELEVIKTEPVETKPVETSPVAAKPNDAPTAPVNAPLPVSLLERLERESSDIESGLVTGTVEEMTGKVKALADRKLLALTSTAVDVLGDGMKYGPVKDRVSAAVQVLDRSPATKPQSVFGTEQSIPIEALKGAMAGMALMLKGVSSFNATLRNVSDDSEVK